MINLNLLAWSLHLVVVLCRTANPRDRNDSPNRAQGSAARGIFGMSVSGIAPMWAGLQYLINRTGPENEPRSVFSAKRVRALGPV